MASEASGLLDAWPVQLMGSIFFPQSPYLVVRIIAGVFAVLGIAFVFPIVCLIVFDVGLWIWRLYSVNRNAYIRQQQQEQLRQRINREQRRQLREQLQKLSKEMDKGTAAATSP